MLTSLGEISVNDAMRPWLKSSVTFAATCRAASNITPAKERPELQRLAALAAQRVAALIPTAYQVRCSVCAAMQLADADQVGVERTGQAPYRRS